MWHPGFSNDWGHYKGGERIPTAKATSMTRVKWNFCNNLDFNNRRQGQFPPGYGKKWVETKINTVYRITSPFASKQEIEQ